MFQAQDALFIYCVSPVHMGAGTAIGVIDNPIQRERHTGHPVMAGSGLKGALKHEALQSWGDERLVFEVFGPGTAESHLHAGALSLGDGQLVAFPIRSLREGYVYGTSPVALGRLRRLLEMAGISPGDWGGLETALGSHPDACAVLDKRLLANGHLVLEAFQFRPVESCEPLAKAAAWLADHALPPGEAFGFFRNKLRQHLVLLPEERFDFFVKNAVLVEPHVRIDDATGTADDGGLFYTENLPPESLLVSLVMASRSRREGSDKDAREILDSVRQRFQGKLAQVGGDATSGRGQVALRFTGSN